MPKRSPKPRRWTQQFAPEWFYPPANQLHAELQSRVEDLWQEGNPPGRFEPNSLGASRPPAGPTLVALSRSNVYMSICFHLGDRAYTRYKLRVPRSRFPVR